MVSDSRGAISVCDVFSHSSSFLVPQLDPPILELYCLIRGDDANHIFPVEIASSKSVGALKEIVREKNKFSLEHMDAKTLTLWKVSIPVDDSLKENVKKVELNDEEMLSPVHRLSSIFPDPPLQLHLHIIIKFPPGKSISSTSQRPLLYKGDRVAEARKAWGSSVSQEAPSSGGLPKKFLAVQKKEKPAFAIPYSASSKMTVKIMHPPSETMISLTSSPILCHIFTPTKGTGLTKLEKISQAMVSTFCPPELASIGLMEIFATRAFALHSSRPRQSFPPAVLSLFSRLPGTIVPS